MELVFLAELVDLFLVPVFGFVVLLFEVVLRRLLEVCFEDVFALGDFEGQAGGDWAGEFLRDDPFLSGSVSFLIEV